MKWHYKCERCGAEHCSKTKDYAIIHQAVTKLEVYGITRCGGRMIETKLQ